jgi:hypothetical protein
VVAWDVGVDVDPAVTGGVYAFVTGQAATTILWRAHIEALVTPWK